MTIQVGIVMGSDSDLSVMRKAAEILERFDIPHSMTVASAHRTPERVAALAQRAEEEGWKVIIAGAGMAAHLAGFLAAHTIVPIIGVPLASSTLGGLDALLSTVQMPGGVPVGAMGLGAAGAKNAGLFAVQILAVSDPSLQDKLRQYRQEQRESIEEKAAHVEAGREKRYTEPE
ncbi:MAG: 5-(carboxyamino)imidazole ribonucleotide mutase [Desulfomonilaceae bacterium]